MKTTKVLSTQSRNMSSTATATAMARQILEYILKEECVGCAPISAIHQCNLIALLGKFLWLHAQSKREKTVESLLRLLAEPKDEIDMLEDTENSMLRISEEDRKFCYSFVRETVGMMHALRTSIEAQPLLLQDLNAIVNVFANGRAFMHYTKRVNALKSPIIAYIEKQIAKESEIVGKKLGQAVMQA